MRNWVVGGNGLSGGEMNCWVEGCVVRWGYGWGVDSQVGGLGCQVGGWIVRWGGML